MLSDKSSKPDDDKHIHQRDKTHASRHLDKRRVEILRTNLAKLIGEPIVPPGFIERMRAEIRTIESRLEKQGRHSLPQPKEKGFSAKDKKQLMVLLQALTDLTGDPNVSTENIRELQGKIDDLLARKG